MKIRKIENQKSYPHKALLIVLSGYFFFMLLIAGYLSNFTASADSYLNKQFKYDSFEKFAGNKKHILVLNSYNRDLRWTDDISAAIVKKLQSSLNYPEFFLENMDTKRHFSEEYLRKFFEILKFKYSQKKIDVVITTDDDAFNFTQKYYSEFFKDIPIVFCGVNFLDETKIKNKKMVTGIIETINIKDNISLALNLNPGLKKIVFITDNTTTGIANKKVIKDIEPEFKGRLEFIIYDPLTIDKIAKKVSELENDSAVIFLTYSQDSTGKFFSLEESIDYILSGAKVPAYCAWDFYLEKKVVGGKLICGKTQGEMAADYAMSILNGQSASKIPIQQSSPSNYYFNYNQLTLYNINESELPPDHTIINKPLSFYAQYKFYFLTAVVVLTLLAAIIIILIINIYRRKKAETELTKAKNELENRVEERTHELQLSLSKIQDEILKRHKVEQVLDESESRYKTLTENIYDLIIETDSSGNCLYVSPNYNEITGYFPDELLGKKFLDLIHHEDLNKVIPEFDKLFKVQGKTIHELTIKMKAKNGNYNLFEINAKTYKTSFDEIRAVIVSREITLRKKTDEEMLKATKLESVGILAGGIAHDFNNILMGVVGNLSLAKKRVAKDEKTYEILTRAEKVAFKAKNLTEQLITFSKGGFPIKKNITISDLVKESVKFALTGSNVICKFMINDNIAQVEVDEGQIAQVITNLAINAKQAMPEGGNIDVTIKNVTVNGNEIFSLNAGNYIKISLKDTGTGIAPENLKKIFDPYFTTKPTGNGLGLATVYSIVKNHGGAVTVDSTINVGTTFSIYLPECGSDNNGPADQGGKPVNNFILNVLLMDEDEIILTVTEQMLVNSGHKACLTSNYDDLILEFKKAFEKKETCFNAVILSTQNGTNENETEKIKEVMSKLKEINPNVNAIITSINPDNNIVLNYKNFGFKASLIKPYQQKELQNILISIAG